MTDQTTDTPFNPNNILIPETFVGDLLGKYGVMRSFENIDLYRCATVHKSYCTRKNENFIEGNVDCPSGCLPLQEESNERLEFLGDSVLGMVIAGYLFERYPDSNEGFLTRLRTKIVNGKMLAWLCDAIGLQKYILLSRQIDQNNGRSMSNILEDAFEAFIGAIYIDLGFESVKTWITNVVEYHLDFSELIRTNTNYKDQIIKHFQHTHGYVPRFYEVDVRMDGNNHKTFKVCIKDKHDRIVSTGTGSNKKEAENMAAKNALDHLGVVAT